MTLRKINAVFSLITTLMLMAHAVSHGVWMMWGVSIGKIPAGMPWILFWFMIAHAFISIALGVLGHKGAEKRKCNDYPSLNKSTIVQRMSGVSLIILTILHIAGATGVLYPPQIVHAILPPLFFAIALMHTAISIHKAFITLGIGNAKLIKIVGIAAKIICGATLIVDVVGFYRLMF